MNIELFKKTAQEDYQRRLDFVVPAIEKLAKEDTTGLFKRILNFDRSLLFSCMGDIVDISQTSVLSNRDELSFLESLCHLFNYYFKDDGELMIKWGRYSIAGGGKWLPAKEGAKGAEPYLAVLRNNDCLKAKEKDVHAMLDWVEKNHAVRAAMMKEFDPEDAADFEKKEFIDYN